MFLPNLKVNTSQRVLSWFAMRKVYSKKVESYATDNKVSTRYDFLYVFLKQNNFHRLSTEISQTFNISIKTNIPFKTFFFSGHLKKVE